MFQYPYIFAIGKETSCCVISSVYLKTYFREYHNQNEYDWIVPRSLDEQYNNYWNGVSRLVLVVHGMNGDSEDDDIRGIEYDFPGTKTFFLDYEKVFHKKTRREMFWFLWNHFRKYLAKIISISSKRIKISESYLS